MLVALVWLEKREQGMRLCGTYQGMDLALLDLIVDLVSWKTKQGLDTLEQLALFGCVQQGLFKVIICKL